MRIKVPQQQQQRQKQQENQQQQQPRELHESENRQGASGDSQVEDMHRDKQWHTYDNSPIDKLLQGNGEIMLHILTKLHCLNHERGRRGVVFSL